MQRFSSIYPMRAGISRVRALLSRRIRQETPERTEGDHPDTRFARVERGEVYARAQTLPPSIVSRMMRGALALDVIEDVLFRGANYPGIHSSYGRVMMNRNKHFYNRYNRFSKTKLGPHHFPETSFHRIVVLLKRHIVECQFGGIVILPNSKTSETV